MHNSKQDEHSKNKTSLSNAACTNTGREIETTVEYLCGWDNTSVSTGGSWLSQEDKQTARPELTYWLKKYLQLKLFNGEISSDFFSVRKCHPQNYCVSIHSYMSNVPVCRVATDQLEGKLQMRSRGYLVAHNWNTELPNFNRLDLNF